MPFLPSNIWDEQLPEGAALLHPTTVFGEGVCKNMWDAVADGRFSEWEHTPNTNLLMDASPQQVAVGVHEENPSGRSA